MPAVGVRISVSRRQDLHSQPAGSSQVGGSAYLTRWGITTDKAGELFGVICPSCITGELLSMTTKDRLTADAA